jgi:hypothetical protein
LLPYGMALGGGAMGGGTGSTAPSSSGGKSSPPAQNNYSPSFGGQSVAPTTAAAPSGGKSSGAGLGGYGMAPGFGGMGGMPISGTGGELFGGQQSPNMPMQSGKSSGLGQGGYGRAPGFGGQLTPEERAQSMQGGGIQGFNGTFSPEALAFQQANPQPQQPTSQMEDMVRMMSTGSDRGTDPAVANQMMNQLSGMRDNFMRNPPQQMQQGMGGMGGMAAQRGMQGGFGPQAPTQDAYNNFRAMTGSPASFEEFSQSRGNKFTQQPSQMGGIRGIGGLNDQQRLNQERNNFLRSNPAFQQQQPVSGLQSLFNNMMGQQQMQQPMQQMPRFQSQALQYRPDMQNAQSALSRVKPSVQKQGQDAQAARIAELEAQIAAFQPSTSNFWNGSGGN